jgi:Domain of unknown function (DUF1906)
MNAISLLRAAGSVSILSVAFSACSGAGTSGPPVGTSSAAITPIQGCDYSFARPTPSSLVSMGYQFVARYLSGDPTGGKDLTASEMTSLEAAGLDIVLTWETDGTDCQNGMSAGVSDAQAAESEVESIGAPITRPIYFAVDFDADSSDATACNAYFQGVASVIGLNRTGVYGGYYIVNELMSGGLATWGWQTYAWSNGEWDSAAQLRQTDDGIDNDELDADEGMVADYGQFGPNAPVGSGDAGSGGSGDAGSGAPAGSYGASYVSQSFPLATTPLNMVEGQVVSAWIELKNTGSKAWDSNTWLATTQPEGRVSVFADGSWVASDAPARVTGTVAPGDTYKFQWTFHAPAMTGTFNEYFGMEEHGVTWFSAPGQLGPPDDDIEVQIVVTVPEGGVPLGGDAGEPGNGGSPVDGGSSAVPDAGRTGSGTGSSGGLLDGGGIVVSRDGGNEGTGGGAGGHTGTGGSDASASSDDAGSGGVPAGSSGGCSVAGGASFDLSLLPLLGLVVARRRRSATKKRDSERNVDS